jgi:hypothetical protein
LRQRTVCRPGGWCSSTMRKRPSLPVSSSMRSSAPNWRSPRRPVARNGAEGRAVDRTDQGDVAPKAQRRKHVGAFRGRRGRRRHACRRTIARTCPATTRGRRRRGCRELP